MIEEEVEAEEGYREVPYLDTEKKWTVGIGTCLETSPLTGEQWKALLDTGLITVRLTHAGARVLMRQRLAEIDAQLSLRVASWAKLDQARKNVLTSMAYQMGVGFVRKFPNFIAAVNRGDWQAAAMAGRDSLWRRQTPARAERLMTRLEKGL